MNWKHDLHYLQTCLWDKASYPPWDSLVTHVCYSPPLTGPIFLLLYQYFFLGKLSINHIHRNLFTGNLTYNGDNKNFNLLPRNQWKNKRTIGHLVLSSWIWAFSRDMSQMSRCAGEGNQLILYIQIHLGRWKYMPGLQGRGRAQRWMKILGCQLIMYV